MTWNSLPFSIHHSEVDSSLKWNHRCKPIYFFKLYGNPQLFLMHLLSIATHFCALFCFASYLWDVSFVVFSCLFLFETPVFMFFAFNQTVYFVLDCNVFWASPVGQGAIETVWVVCYYYFLRSLSRLLAVGVWFGGIMPSCLLLFLMTVLNFTFWWCQLCNGKRIGLAGSWPRIDLGSRHWTLKEHWPPCIFSVVDMDCSLLCGDS